MMRPRPPSVTLPLAVAAAFLAVPAPAHAAPASAPAAPASAPAPPSAPRALAAAASAACDAPAGRRFPIATRVHGGPTGYASGGGRGQWTVDLANTTGRACGGIHPVLVLVDDRRALRPAQPHLEFDDGHRYRPVRLTRTDEDELVGAFGDKDGFPGFTVPAHRTVSVRVRLAFAADAAANQVTARAAVVQRHGGDGDWVGESNAYRFAIGPDVPASAVPDPASPDAALPPGASTEEPGGGTESGTGGWSEPSSAGSYAPSGGTSAAASPGTGSGVPSGAASPGALFPFTGELAETGPGLPPAVFTTVAGLLVAGGGLLLAGRRLRR
ncbi:hypothetical protein ACIQU5_06050 [Streptomyces sp. NPDC090306]|uniref:hypothetical protein n=1 Tax=unclassified Streptomyces TaxID=2593676 RepID=UPI0036E5EEC7